MAIVHVRGSEGGHFTSLASVTDLAQYAAVVDSDELLKVSIGPEAKVNELRVVVAALVAAKRFPIELTFYFDEVFERLRVNRGRSVFSIPDSSKAFEVEPYSG